MPNNLKDRIALVTGASRGIGRAAALELARRGAHIIALSRPISQAALEELDDEITELGGKCTIVPLDLRDGDGIDRLGALIYERWGRLDVLVANAGVLGTLTPLGHLDPKDWQELLDVNLTANWRLIRALDPILKLSKAGRAIFVSSADVGKNRPYWGGYTISKAALDALAMTYAAECEITNIKVNIVDPGPTATRMRAKAMPGEDPDSLPQPADLAPLFAELADENCDTHGELIRYREWVEKK